MSVLFSEGRNPEGFLKAEAAVGGEAVAPGVESPRKIDSIMSPIAANLQAVRRRISEALQGDRRAVTLVAVSKSQPPEAIRAAFAAGLADFGESYVQEGVAKMALLRDLAATWHFIGRLQGNKVRDVAASFDWVHGVDRARMAQARSKARGEGLAPLDLCIQVNIRGEASKGGVQPREAA
ncbi:MAG TPA: YggS family pyridoxal phosphate-dependent enzyme, partial [Usitatibacter sp.]